MALPASAQARLEALRSEAPAETPPVEAPATVVTTPVNGESVTISRDEFNELQAAAGRVKAAEGRAESVQMDVETLQSRLTALEAAGKANSQGERTPAAAVEADDDWQPTAVSFTEDETKEYAESRAFVEKVVHDVLNKVLPKLLVGVKNVKGKLAEIETTVTQNVQRTQQIEGSDFTAKVKEKVGNFDEVVNHQHWRAFAESEDAATGETYAETIARAVSKQKLDVVVRCFNEFKKKYGLTGRPTETGYEGGASGNGSRLPETNNEPEMLPLSKRKEAHKKWLNKEITESEYQRIYDQYAAADKEGRVDYNA